MLPAGLAPLAAALADAFGADGAAAIAAGLGALRTPSFRANLLRATPAAVRADCAAAGIRCDPHPLAPWAFTTDAAGEAALKRSALVAEGRVYLQSLPSQLAGLLADPRPGADWLDACAAPGGKTALLAMLSGPDTPGIALERARVRFGILRHNLARQGCAQVDARCQDARSPSADIRRRRFARVLVDAPCSGSGTLDPARPRTWAHLDGRYPGYVAIKAATQLALLATAAGRLAPGGILTYSTCAVDPAENEGVVDAALRRLPWLAAVPLPDPPALPTPRRAAAARLAGRALHPEVAHALRLDPGPGGEGFFVARFVLRRTPAA